MIMMIMIMTDLNHQSNLRSLSKIVHRTPYIVHGFIPPYSTPYETLLPYLTLSTYALRRGHAGPG
jgi:hypothetical protein